MKIIKGSDLERWRISKRISKSNAAEVFGLPIAKWDTLTSQNLPIEDQPLKMLYLLYTTYAESVPIEPELDIQEFYCFLGFTDSLQDKKEFSALIGRSPSAAYRILAREGKASRTVIKWLEGIKRLNLPALESKVLMRQILLNINKKENKI